MPKFRVCIYHETYTDYIVNADTADEAKDKVMQGEYDDIDDTTVKESEPISVTEVKNEDSHVNEDQVEQQRRDEKNGLYPEHEDPAN